ncbi:hypothetical protein BJV82DRAFT_635309 [Fennellomyces sp. T-0311]|nr:hypothetical protein BJV82DRAFT_635309 [Fennellomyces sp. T-0311]
MSGTENQVPMSSPLPESVQTPEFHSKKRGQTSEFKVYNENVSSNQTSPASSPARSPLREKAAVSPTVVVPAERGRRSPASVRVQSPPHVAKKPVPLGDRLQEALYDKSSGDENVKEQIVLLRKQYNDRQAQLDTLKQQKKECDQQLREAKAKTASLQKQLRDTERQAKDAEVTLKRTEEETLAMREHMRVMEEEINDNKDIVREYVDVTKDKEAEDVEREKEIDALMNLIPAKLIRIHELKELLGEE